MLACASPMARLGAMKIGLLISAIAGVLLAACATPDATADCVIDPALVMPWGEYHTANEQPAPNVFVYEGCGKRLVHVAAGHTNDPASETFAQVRAALKRWPPGMLVAEGFPEAMGVSPAGLLEYAGQMKGGPGDSEGFEAIRIISAAGGAFTGGEPDERTVLAGLEAQGRSASDLFAFYVIRQIDQWKREQRITDHRDARLDGLIAQLAGMTARDLGIPVEKLAGIATRDGVAAWYERANGLPFDSGYRPEDSHPSGPENNRATNALSDTISDIRDRHITGVISRALESYDTVAVVYGSSHHTIQAPALTAAFGPARFAGRLAAAQ